MSLDNGPINVSFFPFKGIEPIVPESPARYSKLPSIFPTPEQREEIRHHTQTTLPRPRHLSQEYQTTRTTEGLFHPSLSTGVQSSPRRRSNRARRGPAVCEDGGEFVRKSGADAGMWNTAPSGSGSSFFSSASNIGIEGGHFNANSSTYQNRTNLTINILHSPLADNPIIDTNIFLPHYYSYNAHMLPYGQNMSPLDSMGTRSATGTPLLSSHYKPQAGALPVLQFESEKFSSRKRAPKKCWYERVELIGRDPDEENNADDEDEDELAMALGARWGGNGSTDESPQIRPRRASAVDTQIKGGEKKYQSRAVQTEVLEGSSDDIQAEAALPPPKRRWTQASHPGAMLRDTAYPPINILQRPPTAPPNDMRGVKPTKAIPSFVSPAPGSRQEFFVPHSTASNVWADPTLTAVSPSTGGIASPSMSLRPLPSTSERVSSRESSLASPASSTSSMSPVYTTAVIPPMGKGKRVWDPARNVDACKRDSIDALTRFWNMGSRDHEHDMSSNDQV